MSRRPGFARQVMPGIVNDPVALELTRMIGDDFIAQHHDNALSMRAHQNHSAGGARIDAVAIVVGHDQAGGAGPDRLLDEPVERAAKLHQARPFLLEHVPDRSILELGMPGSFGVGDALIFQPCIQLGQAFHPRLGSEHLVPQVADLVLDLTLLPARRGRAGYWFDQMVRAHLEKAAIIPARFAHEDRLDRRLHVMGWTSPAFLPASLNAKEESMSLKLLAIDLGKRSFHCHGIDSDGLIISRKTSRSKLLETIRELAPETVAMEACASAHYWGRLFLADGRQVLLINPRFVKPFVKGSKNDAADAEGIYEAALRPTMRSVPVKWTEQQDLQSLHRARERIVCARTALINHMRGLLGEYGVILPQGAWRFLAQAQEAIAAAELSDLTRELFGDLLDELRGLDLRLDKLDRQLVALCRTNEACRRLSKLPGVGPVIATALVAAVDDGRHFRSGRELAAWIGLVPRQYTTGGKPRLGGIGRRANHYLRRQMIHGARAVMFRLARHDDRRSQWLKELTARRGFNRAIVALANKTARIAWAVLTRKEDYLATA